MKRRTNDKKHRKDAPCPGCASETFPDPPRDGDPACACGYDPGEGLEGAEMWKAAKLIYKECRRSEMITRHPDTQKITRRPFTWEDARSYVVADVFVPDTSLISAKQILKGFTSRQRSIAAAIEDIATRCPDDIEMMQARLDAGQPVGDIEYEIKLWLAAIEDGDKVREAQARATLDTLGTSRIALIGSADRDARELGRRITRALDAGDQAKISAITDTAIGKGFLPRAIEGKKQLAIEAADEGEPELLEEGASK